MESSRVEVSCVVMVQLKSSRGELSCNGRV